MGETPGVPWETISSRVKIKGEGFAILTDRVKLPPPAETIITYTFMDHRGSVVMVPFTESGETILVEQYRYPIKSMSLEFPSGGVKEAEESDPELAARRELLEEIGLKANKVTLLGTFYPSNSISSERFTAFLVEGLKQVEHRQDPTELITVNKLPFSAVRSKIERGEITDGPTIIAYFLAEKFLKGRK